jgi:hypothetical protein
MPRCSAVRILLTETQFPALTGRQAKGVRWDQIHMLVSISLRKKKGWKCQVLGSHSGDYKKLYTPLGTTLYRSMTHTHTQTIVLSVLQSLLAASW